MSWDARKTSTLIELWYAGASTRYIAVAVGETRNAVIGKIGVLGLKKKEEKVSIDIQRATPVVENITRDNQQIGVQVTNLMNQIALTRAMQEGYRMACRDNGLPVPDMEDPRVTFGFGGAV